MPVLPTGGSTALMLEGPNWLVFGAPTVMTVSMLVFTWCVWLVAYLWAWRGLFPTRWTAIAGVSAAALSLLASPIQDALAVPAVFNSGAYQTTWGMLVGEWMMLAAGGLGFAFVILFALNARGERLYQIPVTLLVHLGIVPAVIIMLMNEYPEESADPVPSAIVMFAVIIAAVGSVIAARTIRAMRARSGRIAEAAAVA